jgi:DNA-binding CsgD family transcriptional regulator
LNGDIEDSIARAVLRLAIQIAPNLSPTQQGASTHTQPKEDGLEVYRRRLVALDCGLTSRELDVCARSLLGMTAEGIALDLNIKPSSVITYRKRAYERLHISSRYELFRRVA